MHTLIKTTLSTLILTLTTPIFAHYAQEHILGMTHATRTAWDLSTVLLLFIVLLVAIRYVSKMLSK